METSASFEARSAPLPYPTGSSARTDPRGRAGSNVRPYRDSFLPLVAGRPHGVSRLCGNEHGGDVPLDCYWVEWAP